MIGNRKRNVFADPIDDDHVQNDNTNVFADDQSSSADESQVLIGNRNQFDGPIEDFMKHAFDDQIEVLTSNSNRVKWIRSEVREFANLSRKYGCDWPEIVSELKTKTKKKKATYGIPKDNPFKKNKDGIPQEIFHYGVRNPWRNSFDRDTGDLFIGDVGQNKIEEISIAEKGEIGLNFGWRLLEGMLYDPCIFL